MSEVGNSRVQRFSATGEVIEEVAPLSFAMPHGLGFDSAGALYVADTGNAAIKIFRFLGEGNAQ